VVGLALTARRETISEVLTQGYKARFLGAGTIGMTILNPQFDFYDIKTLTN
jgi:hypothetical protein